MKEGFNIVGIIVLITILTVMFLMVRTGDRRENNVTMMTLRSEMSRMATEVKNVKEEEMRLGVVADITETALNHVNNNVTYDLGKACYAECHGGE